MSKKKHLGEVVVEHGEDWWNNWFLNLAKYVSTASKDPSTQVGCVIVGPDKEIRSTGFNGFPRGVSDTLKRLNTRELKYPLICHGEENAITHAARIGISLKGCAAYVYPWPPCTRCARSLIQAGVNAIYYSVQYEIPERWKDEFNLSAEVLEEAGVKVIGL